MAENVDAAVRLKLEDLMSSGLARVKGELKGVGDATHDAGRKAETSGGLFSGMLGTFAKVGLAATGIAAIAGALKGLVGGLVSGNAEFERYEVQFGVLLGSVDKAKERIGALAKFAATTPFELPEVVKAGKVLETFGLQGDKAMSRFGKSTEQILQTVGDAAAGSGARFDELALTFGKFSSGATGEALMRLQELGITTREELANMGVHFDKSGALLSGKEETLAKIFEAVDKRFGGMMVKQSQTFEGMVSNLSDWIGQTKRKLMEPIFEVVKDKLGALLEFLNDPATGAALEAFAAKVATGIGTAMDVIGGVVDTVSGVVSFLKDAWVDPGLAMDDFHEIVMAKFGVTSAGIPTIVDQGVKLIADTIESMGDVVGKVMEGDIPGALGIAFDAYGNFRQGVVTILTDALPEILETMNGWARAAIDWITTKALPELKQKLPLIASEMLAFVLATADKLVEAITSFARAFFEWVGPAIGPLLSELLGLLGTMIKWIGDHAEEIGQKLAEWAGKFAEVIVTVAIPALLQALPGIIWTIASWVVTEGIPGVLRIFAGVGKGIITGILDGLGNLASAVADAIRDALRSIDFWIGPFHISGRTGITVRMPTITLPQFNLPSFASGGIVPGAPGMPQLVVAHGGEPIGRSAGAGLGGGAGPLSITTQIQVNGKTIAEAVNNVNMADATARGMR